MDGFLYKFGMDRCLFSKSSVQTVSERSKPKTAAKKSIYENNSQIVAGTPDHGRLHQRRHAPRLPKSAPPCRIAPGYSAVRALLRILEDKGHVKHRREGARYVYLPRASRETARRSALKRRCLHFLPGIGHQADGGFAGNRRHPAVGFRVARIATNHQTSPKGGPLT